MRKSKKGIVRTLLIALLLMGIVTIFIFKDNINRKVNQFDNKIPQVYQQKDIDYWRCDKDNDCEIAINLNGCCSCPDSINKKYIGQDKWEVFDTIRNYFLSSSCGEIACEQCVNPGRPTCINSKCSFETN